jgi:exodeoxyribonuclease VII small subunit
MGSWIQKSRISAKLMANNQKQFDFTKAISRLEEINTWFQNEDFNLDEGLQKLKEGKDLIKKSRTRLQEVENEFVKIKQEFAEEGQEQVVNAGEDLPQDNGATRKVFNGQAVEPEQSASRHPGSSSLLVRR